MNELEPFFEMIAERVASKVLERLRVQPDELLDLHALRDQYRLCPGTVRAAVKRGDLSASRGPRQRLLIRRSEVDRWLTARPVQPQPKGKAPADLDAWETSAEKALTTTRTRQGSAARPPGSRLDS